MIVPTNVLATLTAFIIATPHAAKADVQRGVSIDAGQEVVRETWPAPRRLDAAADGPLSAGGLPFGVFLSTNADPEGDMPRELAFTPDGETVIIVHRDTDNVAFYDVDTQAVTDTVAVQDFPVQVAVTPDGRYAVVPNVLSHTVSIVDLATRAIAAHVPVTGEQPYRAAVTSDSRFAVVGVINDAVTSAFAIIDLETLTEVSSIDTGGQGLIGFFGTPEIGVSGGVYSQFALAPDDRTIVLPERGNARVLIYDRATGDEAVIPTNALPSGVDISSDGAFAVVTHEEFNQPRISVINLEEAAVDNVFAVGEPLANQLVRLTPDDAHAIAAISNNVIFVNLSTGATTATISTGVVGDIELSFDGQYAFVSNFNSRVIDIATQSLVATLPLAPCAEAAASPTEFRAAALNNRFREDIHLYNVNGAAGFVEGFTISGPPPEGDATRSLALSADGTLAVAGNLVSRNVSIINVHDGSVRSYVDTGDRILDVAVTPDGTHAVVANGDANTVSVIDLATDTEVANIAVNTRPARVRISPDSATAYVLTVAGTDRIHFINLDGENSAVTGSVISGQTGSAQGYPYTEISGIELSPDGAILAACVSFEDALRLIDTETQTVLTNVPTGDFPIRVVFSPDGQKAYVANAFGDSVTVVNIDGAASTAETTVGGVDFPLTLDPDADGSFVYVGTFGQNSAALRVLNTTTNTFVQSLNFGGVRPRATHFGAAESVLYLAGANEFIRVNANGAASSVIDSVPITNSPFDMVFDDNTRTAVISQPVPDGVDFIVFGVPGDFDGDLDRDLDDFAAYVDCATPPAPGTLAPACAVFDFDNDDDADLADLAQFLLLFGTE